jgi:GntR family transcriptional regulator
MRRGPKYLRIREALRQEIEAGRYPPGSPLPSQRLLAERFGVTLMTIRQAIGLLEEEGVVATRQGSGTFVRQRPFAYGPGPLRSLAREIAATGGVLETTVTGASPGRAPGGVAERLGAPAGGEVFVLERLRVLDGEPLLLQRSYLPVELGSLLVPAELTTASLYDLLQRDAGVTVARATETITAVALGAPDARALGHKARSPGLLSRRRTFDAFDRPVLEDWALLPAGRVVLTLERNAEALAPAAAVWGR